MAIKRKGIIAVPGEYRYGDMVEVKTAEELKAAAERQPIIMLTKGHPVDGMPSAKDVIGTVSQKWNEKNQRVEGDFWFHEEKIPESIRENVVNMRPVGISPGYMIDGIGDNGEQEGMVYTHLAVLDDEDPRCPLGECGVNIRMDSKEGPRLVRFDQRSDLEAPEEPAKEEIIERVKKEDKTPFGDIPETVEAEPEPTEEETPPAKEPESSEEVVEESEPAIQKEEVAEEVEDIPREPEVVIPTSTGTASGLEAAGIKKVGKYYEYVPEKYRNNEDK